MSTPGFVAIGHVVRDLLPDGGWRLGGTVTFAALQAQRLGVNAGVVTSAAADVPFDQLLADIDVINQPTEHSTCFVNEYDGATRSQRVTQQAAKLTTDDVPPEWNGADVVLLGPVCGELSSQSNERFSGVVGVSAQGWLRELDNDRRVVRRPWRGEPFWTACDVLFVSDEDLGDDRAHLDRWIDDIQIVAVTSNRRGARVHDGSSWRSIEAFPAGEVDPTGAGDVFAAAFLVRYHETGDVPTAVRFAAGAAACSVEAPGAEGVATREQIEARIVKHPGIVLR